MSDPFAYVGLVRLPAYEFKVDRFMVAHYRQDALV